MTFCAFAGNQLFRGGEFVDVAVTRNTGRFAEDGVGAGGEKLGLVRMAGGALHFDDFLGVRELFDVGVAVFAAKNPVCAGCVPGRVDRNALSRRRTSFPDSPARQTFLVSRRARPGPAKS